MFFKRINNNISLLMHKVQNYSQSCGFRKSLVAEQREGDYVFRDPLLKTMARLSTISGPVKS